jgi:preprotein translocase subunit SecG
MHSMKIWKIAALVALATIPLILLNSSKKKDEGILQGDTDNIFEHELSAD